MELKNHAKTKKKSNADPQFEVKICSTDVRIISSLLISMCRSAIYRVPVFYFDVSKNDSFYCININRRAFIINLV